MAFSTKTLYEGTMLTTGAVTLYTSPSMQRTIVTKFTLCNVTASPVTVTLYIIGSGGVAADNYKIFHQVTLDAAQAKDVPEMRHTLEPGDFVQGLCSANSSVTTRASGILIST